MEAENDIPCAHVAAFVRQHTHDLRNDLNSLDLEAGMLQELVADEEAAASTQRIRKQLRTLADRLRALSAMFHDPEPYAAPISARDLLLIWREQVPSVPHADEVRWVDQTGSERAKVDVELMLTVFRELLSNAVLFSQGVPATITAKSDGGSVVFEIVEPKTKPVNPAHWGRPLASTRHGGYGLGLWATKRIVKANGGTLEQGFNAERGELLTRLVLPAA